MWHIMITINDACIDLIKSFEGLSLEAYHDKADKPGIDTLGYGTIQYPPDYLRGKRVAIGDPDITIEQARDFLKWEISLKARLIDPLIRDDLTPNQFGALISFAYNLGEGALKMSTLRKKVNANPADKTIRSEFAKWIFSNGKQQEGLIRRRAAEADLYFTI
jgi:lysozyme